MTNLFDFDSSLDFLRFQIRSHRHVFRYKSQLAEAAGCQASYLSQVLAEKALLSADHMAGLCAFWKLSSLEEEYLLTLVLQERAGSPHLKKFLNQKLESIRVQGKKLVGRIEKEVLGEAPPAVYYATWYYTAIHVLVTIPDYQTEPAIAEKLGLSVERVTQALQVLRGLGLVEQKSGKWQATKTAVHIPRDSVFQELNHTHWRQRSVLAVQNRTDRLSYTGIHSLSRKDIEEVWRLAVEFLKEARGRIGDSPPEELVCLNCDLFVVG